MNNISNERPPINLFLIVIPTIMSSILTSNSYITVIPCLLLIIYSYYNNFSFPRNSFNSTISCLMIFGVSILLHVFIITDLPTGNGPHVMAASMIVLMVYLWYYQNPKITTNLIVLLCILVMIFTGNNINNESSKYPLVVHIFMLMMIVYLFPKNSKLRILLIASSILISISSFFLNKLLFFADDKITSLLQDIIQNSEYTEKQGFSNELDIKNQVNLKISKKPIILYKGKKVSYLRGDVLVNYSRKSWSSLQKSFGDPKLINFENKDFMTYDSKSLKRVFTLKNNLILNSIDYLESTKNISLPINTYMFSKGNYKVKPYNILYSNSNINHIDFYTLNERNLSSGFQNDEVEIDRDLKNTLFNLSNKITEKDNDNLSKAQSILNYFQNYKYSLEVNFDKDKEPIVDFIFNKKSGFCLHFASAMALMLRSIDVPTHIVSGYIVNEYNSSFDAYIIRERDAHAWVEVFDDKSKSWKTFDPTPSAQMSYYMNTQASIFEQIYLYFKIIFIKFKNIFNFFSMENLQKIGSSPYSLIILILGTIFIVFRNYKIKNIKNDISKETKTFLDNLDKVLKPYKIEFSPYITYNELSELINNNENIPIKIKEQTIKSLKDFQIKRYNNF
ncbi:MAG: transglutaminase-like domain-containing protein [Candidatus Sericytochromatia bacterium]